MTELYCKECKKTTNRIVRGFEFYNRRYECSDCGHEIWEKKNEQ